MRVAQRIDFGFCYPKCSRLSGLILAALIFGVANPSYAQQVKTIENSEAEVEEEAPIKMTLDLGRFKLRENRPTSNVTAKVTFEVHLLLSDKVDEKLFLMLERWKHRLRDQVITAARKTETKDFVEPNLHIFRRNVLLRINRVLKLQLVDEVFVTEYAFTTH